VAAGALVLLATLARPLWTGRVPVFGDLGVFHLPVRDFYARCLKSGEPFDWMPGMHAGFFLTGEGEHGPYHPLHLALYRLLPLDTALATEAVLHYPFMLLGTFVFLRRHAGPAGALLGGLVYTFSANNLYHGQHLNLLAVMAHLPWLLALLEWLALTTGPGRALAAAGVGLLTGSQVLLGQPQALSWSLLAEVLYALFLAGAAPRPLQAGAAWCAAKLLGLAAGGVQLLPTLDFLAHSNRASFDPLYGAFLPWRLIQVVVPNLMVRHVPQWWDEPFYFGAPAVVLLLWWLTARRWVGADAGARRLTGFAVTLGVLATWLATGSYGGLYLVQTRLPLVGQFRAPSRYVNLTAFAGAVLAGVAFGRLAALVRARRTLPRRHLVLPWLAAAAAVAAGAAFQAAYPPESPHGWDRRFASGALAMVAAAGALTLAARGRTLGLYGLVVLAALDLSQHTLKNRMWGQPLWNDTPTLAEFKAATELPPESNRGRVFAFTGYPVRMLLLGERLVNGYRGGLEPARRLDYRTTAALRVAGAAWYREEGTGESLHVVGLESAGPSWYRVPDPLPRVRLVGWAAAGDNPARDLLSLDPAHEALCDRPLYLGGRQGGTAILAAETPGRLEIDTQAPARQLLVVAEGHDPGWGATVDGEPAAVERVNGDFLGCVVGPGSHRVVWTFAPASVRRGKALSLAGLGATLLLGGMALVVRPRGAGRLQ
jgi:hypothetical protein